MRFNSRKDSYFIVFMGATLLFCVGCLFQMLLQPMDKGEIFALVVLVLTIILLVWIWLDTGYTITPNKVTYKSGPFKGSISVDRIQKIAIGKTLWAGLRPATAMKGLVIYYNKYDEIYLSPDSNERFIKLLLNHNPSIKII